MRPRNGDRGKGNPCLKDPIPGGFAASEDSDPGRHRDRVSFVGDPAARVRSSHPQAQCDPEPVLAVLVDVWLPTDEREVAWSDFWPDLD